MTDTPLIEEEKQTETTTTPMQESTTPDIKNLPNNLKPKGELLCFGAAKDTNNAALQKNFERFRKAKKDEIKYRNYVAKQQPKQVRDQAFKDQLRAKFVETAIKYFGVPYAKRYHSPGD